MVSGAAASLAIGLLPYWPLAHKGLGSAVIAAMLLIGVVLWLLRRRPPRWLAHAALGTAAICAIVGAWVVGAGPQDRVIAPFCVSLCIIAAAFLPPRLAATHVSAITGCVVAITAGWRGDPAAQWVVNMLAISLPSAVVNVVCTRLRELAVRDPLTGLANRRILDQFVAAQVSRADRTGRPLSAAALDLDGLKSINDLAGHGAGDQLLISAARGFARALRTDDLLARTGGDEFTLVLPDTNLAEAQLVVQRLRAATPGVAFSAGVVRWSEETADHMLRRADAALYAAKEASGNSGP